MAINTIEAFDSLPDSALVDVKTVSAVLGRSASSIWRDARLGKLAAPIKTGPMTTRWNVGAIRRHIEALPSSAPFVATNPAADPNKRSPATAKPHVFIEPEHHTPDGLIGINGPRQYAYRTPAIYALFQGDQLVYIGQSQNPQGRIGQHAMNKSIHFDSFVVMPTLPHLLDGEEARLINIHKPKYNQMHTR